MNRFSLSYKQWQSLGQFLSLFFLCFFLVISCSSDQGREPTAVTNANGRVTVGTTLKPRTLDPADNYELQGMIVIYNLSETLYSYELGTTNLEPRLATEMPQISEDGLTYTIPVRQGVTFHDGTPFNAEAMAFSLQRFIKNRGKPSHLLGDIVESIEATGEYELTIQLQKPFAAFPALLAFTGTCAISPEAYEIGAGQFNPNKFVGTGPYQLVEFGSNSMRLDVFENYWGEKPSNQGIDMQIYASNPVNLFNAFRTGATDVAYQSFDPQQIKSLREGASQGKWQAIEGSGTAVSYMTLNLRQEPLNQPEVRKAIAAMVDRPLIVERLLRGQGEPIYSLIPTTFNAYQPVFEQKYGDGNFDLAKQQLQQAGYSADNPVMLEVWYPSGSTIRGSVAATLQALGEQKLDGAIQFQPKSIESASFFSNIGKGLYPITLVDWYPDFLDPDNYIYPFLHCAEGSQASGCKEGASQTQGSFYYSDHVNQLIAQERREQDPEARQEIFVQIQQILAEDVPYIPLWQSKDYAFAQNGVSGVTINPSQDFPFWVIEK
ncbi:MAG: peptide ABC transporter substrate-binding protein [Cyanobacteria bacterium QS_4_48_99]|nr:MAG: peptide ABC transporter substrate-binding protein [Cyanobacteria bacterium QH_10_48_56]PSO78917.1 MAG: peptide ABC transporter substrate-binding protein [Cyanobacteria bacterium QS_4_48_99]PSO93533.1 MAG: peptide ABC transporter substrate-binding protein [Cyanobacteria bacterium QS_6_48_18]